MAWIYLAAAGLLEIGMTTALRYVEWPVRPLPVLMFLVCAASSFALLTVASWTIPLGTAYAIWVGIGAAGTALLGTFFYGEPSTTWRLVFLILLVASIVGLKLVS
jgi:quaternary ammonium compound-resistance protein SugE